MPIVIANKHGPAKSPTDLVNPNADSAKADAHCAIAISEAPAQIIRIIATPKNRHLQQLTQRHSLTVLYQMLNRAGGKNCKILYKGIIAHK